MVILFVFQALQLYKSYPYEVEGVGPDYHSTEKEDDSITISAGRTKHDSSAITRIIAPAVTTMLN